MMTRLRLIQTGFPITASIALISSASLSADTIAQYTFTSDWSADTQDPNVTAKDFAEGANFAATTSGRDGRLAAKISSPEPVIPRVAVAAP